MPPESAIARTQSHSPENGSAPARYNVPGFPFSAPREAYIIMVAIRPNRLPPSKNCRHSRTCSRILSK